MGLGHPEDTHMYHTKWGFPKNGGFPQQPWVFLLKMISTWGVLGVPPFKEQQNRKHRPKKKMLNKEVRLEGILKSLCWHGCRMAWLPCGSEVALYVRSFWFKSTETSSACRRSAASSNAWPKRIFQSETNMSRWLPYFGLRGLSAKFPGRSFKLDLHPHGSTYQYTLWCCMHDGCERLCLCVVNAAVGIHAL